MIETILNNMVFWFAGIVSLTGLSVMFAIIFGFGGDKKNKKSIYFVASIFAIGGIILMSACRAF